MPAKVATIAAISADMAAIAGTIVAALAARIVANKLVKVLGFGH